MQGVLERLATGVRVRLGERVNKITSPSSRQQFVVETEKRKISCEYVILTVSLGVLKAEAGTMFDPALPQEKLEVIDTLGFGTVAKIFLEFPVEVLNLSPGLTSSGLNFLRRAASSPWRNLASQPWQEAIMGLYPCRADPRTLVAWLTGPASAQVEGLSQQEVFKRTS